MDLKARVWNGLRALFQWDDREKCVHCGGFIEHGAGRITVSADCQHVHEGCEEEYFAERRVF